MDQYQRKDTRDNTDSHTGSPGDNTKDTPSFGSEDLKDIHRAGTEAGLLGIYNFPGAVYATNGSDDNGVMGAGFYRLDEN